MQWRGALLLQGEREVFANTPDPDLTDYELLRKKKKKEGKHFNVQICKTGRDMAPKDLSCILK